jgi:hypothetical protein
MPSTSLSPVSRAGPVSRRPPAPAGALVDQPGTGDQLGEHHRDGLQRLDLDLVELALVAMLDRDHADRLVAAHDRDAGETVEQFLAGLGLIGEIGVAGRLVEVERLDILGDRPDQPLAQRHLGDVDRLLLEAAGREQFEHAVAQQVDRADFAVERLADDLDDLIELGLRSRARRHHIVKAGKDFACSGGRGRRSHKRALSESATAFQCRECFGGIKKR